MLSNIYFTTEVEGAIGYEEYPSFLSDIWPLIEDNLDHIQRICAYWYRRGPNIKKLIKEADSVGNNFYDLGDTSSINKPMLKKIRDHSYQGDRSVYYQSQDYSFILKFLSIWPHRSGIKSGIKNIESNEEAHGHLCEFLEKFCGKKTVFFTFSHDADSIFVVGHPLFLEEVLSDIGVQKGRP